MIRRVSVVVAVMFAALMINITVNEVVRAPGLLEDPRNRRVRDAEYSQDRGAIMVGDMAIAETTEAKDSTFKYLRSYPKGGLYAHITGYYSYDYSRSGLELSYNQELAGTDSSQAFTRFIDILSGRQPSGANVVTSIDARAQTAAAEALGDKVGAVMAMDYETGEVLAMVSSPTYDPNLLSTHDLEAAHDSWDALVDDPAGALKNRAANEVYLPGSTFKLVTAAAALESGLNPDSLVDAPDALQLPGTTHEITNAGSCGNGQVTIQEALIRSCNTAFANIGMTLGDDALREQAEAFGFDTELSTDFRTAVSRFPADPDEAQTAMSAIGLYDVAASPMQMMMVAGTIANGGVMMEPHIGTSVVAPDLTVLSTNSPTELGQPISRSTADSLKDMMREVVTSGTAQSANSSVVDIYAKTGTAMQDQSRPNFAWMVGFAEDPNIVVVAMIEDADSARSDISGGKLAGPIVRQVIESVR